MRRRAPAAVAALLAGLAALAGCGLPTAGTVHTVDPTGGSENSGSFDYEPRGPLKGDDPAAIVSGFLDSLRQAPLTYSVARQYLTKDARSSWQPSKRTVVYDDGTLRADVHGGSAELTIGPAIELDSRGSWLGDLTGGQGQSFDLDLVQEDGEWRIAELPDALIVPRSHFDTRFQRYSLYFLDPSGTSLVPEPVYLPSGVQTATLLVAGLLDGPSSDLRTVERTFIPQGTQLDLSVLVDDGVAEIPLDDKIVGADGRQLNLALAQLGWTLRQVPGISRMRVTIDGSAAQGAAGTVRSVLSWQDLDPAGPTDSELYAVQGEDVVTVSGSDASSYSAAFRGVPLRSVAVSPTSGLLAAVSADGKHGYLSTAAGPPAPSYVGDDIARPAYDRLGVVWFVDRTQSGAKVVSVAQDEQHELFAPGISGESVTSFEVSRDGSRLAAIVDGKLMESRISRSETGAPSGLSAAVSLPYSSDNEGVAADLAWIAPNQLGVLVSFGTNSAQVLEANVDGSTFGTDSVFEPVFEPVSDLIGLSGSSVPVFLRAASGTTYQAGLSGHWSVSRLPDALVGLTYPG